MTHPKVKKIENCQPEALTSDRLVDLQNLTSNGLLYFSSKQNLIQTFQDMRCLVQYAEKTFEAKGRLK